MGERGGGNQIGGGRGGSGELHGQKWSEAMRVRVKERGKHWVTQAIHKQCLTPNFSGLTQ